ncbi:hypothetical protein [Hymenobacter sp. GOD-10R]|uniref:hypothetical protein n=1 Tax=Hymenobacter sp. GOD-10R TaxID=3093922 RepID=UPI002D79D688|nr:hypothetical protein [Hymenobacter sp. GOD-10R]WRQ27189.1 hypothetical protein SD425_19135 [Hymenobacter sp. GOD-10R]
MKRPLTHRLFSGFLALLVLTASVGLTVLRHTCTQSGHTSTAVIFSTPHHGCPSVKPAPEPHSASAHLKGTCCDFKANFHKLDASSSDVSWVKSLVPEFVAAWLPMHGWPTAPTAPQVAQAVTWHASDSSPPPRAGRALLTFVCTLVV